MSDWNWIWILVGLGAVWFMFRRGGMGCGMGGHGSHGESDRAGKELDTNVHKVSVEHDGSSQEPSMSTRGSRHRGGCC